MEEAVATRLLPYCGHSLGDVRGLKGCSYVKDKAVAFSSLAAHGQGVLVLTDFRDAKAACVPAALQEYLRGQASKLPEHFLFCFAVNEIESWFLADARSLARFLGISASAIPKMPEDEPYPKKALINLARHSKRSGIIDRMVPQAGHKAPVGPGYMTLMREFVADHWDIEAAAQIAPSLGRCVKKLRDAISR